jgi:hypothetical protein
MPVKILATPKVYTWKLDNINGGLNLEDNPYQLLDNQAQDCKNVYYNQTFCKRPGSRSLNVTATGAPILSMYDYLYKGVLVFSTGTNLCTMNPTLTSYTTVYTGLTAAKGTFFKYNGFLYYINGHEYVKFDGTTCVAVVPYVPTVVINRTPTGGGTSTNNYNRLGAGFLDSFNGDGTSTAYQLTDLGLDATTVTCTVGGVAKVEGTNFTVNRTTGVVTFTVASASGQNNVLITAYKTNATDRNYLLNCTIATAFGGDTSNRIFFAGNNTANYYYSDTANPEYIPILQYNNIGQNDDPISQMAIQNDTMILFKQRSIYGMTYGGLSTAAIPIPLFPVVSLNSNIGCDCPKTVQLVDNKLVWTNSYFGVCTLVNETTAIVSDTVYRNVKPLSRNINGNARRQGLLQESNITSAVAINFNNKYWVAVNGKVYLWDWGLTPYNSQQNQEKMQQELAWWVFDSLPISCFAQDTIYLYFGDTVSGYIEVFENTFIDNGAAINSYWQMGTNHFGSPNLLKTIRKWWCSAKSDTPETIGITYFTDQNEGGVADSQPISIDALFDWNNWDWDNFSWGSDPWFNEPMRKPIARSTKSFSLKLSNNVAGEDMNASNINIQYVVVKEVK